MKQNQTVYFKYLLGNKYIYIYNCAICRRVAHKAIGANIYFFIQFFEQNIFYFIFLIFIYLFFLFFYHVYLIKLSVVYLICKYFLFYFVILLKCILSYYFIFCLYYVLGVVY